MTTEKKTTAKAKAAPVRKETKDKDNEKTKDKYIYAKGGRKTAVAQVRLFKGGKGEITVNGIDLNEYFTTYEMQETVKSPLIATGQEKAFDFSIKTSGSGKSSQSEACRHAIARALETVDSAFRPALKARGFLTRDPRVKERKKPGLRRARRAPQWSKR